MIRLTVVCAVSCVLHLGCGSGEQKSDVEPAVSTATQFDQIIDELSRNYFRELPEIATYYGAPAALAAGANGQLSDRSPEAEAARRNTMEKMLAALKSVDSNSLDPQRRIMQRTLVTLIDGALMPARLADYGAAFGEYGIWFLPYIVNHNSGPTVAIPNLMEAQHRIASAEDAEDYLARLSAYAATMDGVLAKLAQDVELGAIPPDFIVERAQSVISAFAAPAPQDNVLYASFVKKLAAADIADAQQMGQRALGLLESDVLPANQRVYDALESIKASAPHDAGIWRLPNGPALYEAMIRHLTDTEQSPVEIHRIGLEEVQRITAEMDAILQDQAYTEGTVGERFAALVREERFQYADTASGKANVLSDIQLQLDSMNGVLPKWFGTLPKYQVEVRAVPAFSQDSAPGGYYDPPALDGSRPGIYWINLRDMSILSKMTLPTLTYHEALPGHHLQVAVSLGQEAPLISSAVFFSNSSGEGWALYAEALAAEMGAYEGDPYGNLGRLQAELHRAVRLVVDTGMHAMQWSREQAIDYMIATEGAHRSEAVSEIERYTVWPGQALGYKIGMLKLQGLRQEAEQLLKRAFDIREFHDQLLRISSTPLPVIESELRNWMRAKACDLPDLTAACPEV